jgi:site-specific DNA recombinase
LVLSEPKRVEAVRDIFDWCNAGWGFKAIADKLNTRGLPSPRGNLWSFTTIKSLLANPTYRGDLVWNRRTEGKFYKLRNGRADEMKSRPESGKPILLPESDWIVMPDCIPAIVSREDWDNAQLMIQKRQKNKGGGNMQKNRWLLSSVMECGHCGQKFWGEAKRKGNVPEHKRIVTNYYICSGRKRYGKKTCPTPASVRSEKLEKFVLDVLSYLLLEGDDFEPAIERFVEIVLAGSGDSAKADAMRQEISKIDEAVLVLTTNLDPANLALLNGRLTQLRKQKESLDAELRAMNLEQSAVKPESLRQWARKKMHLLSRATAGKRDEMTRQMIAAFVEKIVIYPKTRTGEVILNSDTASLFNPSRLAQLIEESNRLKGTPATVAQSNSYAQKKNHGPDDSESWFNEIAGTGFEPVTSGL